MLKAYMSYSRAAGPIEGAALVFAHSVREAKILAFPFVSDFCDGWTDLATGWIKDPKDVMPLADQEKLQAGTPHLVDNPASCPNCHMWGMGLTDDYGECAWCGEYAGDKLLALFRQYYGTPFDKSKE